MDIFNLTRPAPQTPMEISCALAGKQFKEQEDAKVNFFIDGLADKPHSLSRSMIEMIIRGSFRAGAVAGLGSGQVSVSE